MPNTQGDPVSTTTEVDELHELINALRRCVTSLVSMHGECPAMRRIVNDVERILNGIDRLDIDVDELEMTRGLSQPNGSGEMIQIPDADYHIDFWRDVDHEGIGGQRNAGARISHTQERSGKSRRPA
jgi:pyruvate/oxaloacetate carboxyltransferase